MALKEGEKYYKVVGKEEKGSTPKGRTPGQAAKKVATKGAKDIRLVERGRKYNDKLIRIHVYKGSVKRKTPPPGCTFGIGKDGKIGVSKAVKVRVDKAKKL